MSCKWCTCRMLTYMLGMLMLCSGTVMLIHALCASDWVGRVKIISNKSIYELHYGVWQACDSEDLCEAIWQHFPEVATAARGTQVLMTMSVIFFILGFIAEVIGLLPFVKNSQCRVLIDNRMIEYIISVSAVIAFLGMLIFAGEVKNKAWRQIGQEDETGTGFQTALAGLTTAVLGCCLVACGRGAKPSSRNQAWG